MRRYHGQIPTVERKMVEHDYKTGTAIGIVLYEGFLAWGLMFGDIKHVIHFCTNRYFVGLCARNRKSSA